MPRCPPDGEFTVYTGSRSGQDLLVRIALGEEGPELLHEAFNPDLLGSMTIWPHYSQQFTWWSQARPLWVPDRPDAWKQ